MNQIIANADAAQHQASTQVAQASWLEKWAVAARTGGQTAGRELRLRPTRPEKEAFGFSDEEQKRCDLARTCAQQRQEHLMAIYEKKNCP
jgi:hypothetical protein